MFHCPRKNRATRINLFFNVCRGSRFVLCENCGLISTLTAVLAQICMPVSCTKKAVTLEWTTFDILSILANYLVNGIFEGIQRIKRQAVVSTTFSVHCDPYSLLLGT